MKQHVKNFERIITKIQKPTGSIYVMLINLHIIKNLVRKVNRSQKDKKDQASIALYLILSQWDTIGFPVKGVIMI